MKTRSEILDQISKLMAIASDSAASENEVTTAFERAQRLMKKHAIEEWELENAGPTHGSVVSVEYALHHGKFNKCVCSLACLLGKPNSVRVFIGTKSTGKVAIFIGRETDIERVVTLWQQLGLFCSVHYRLRWRESDRHCSIDQYRRSYYQGFLGAIREKIDSMQAGGESDGAIGKAMILAKDTEVDEYIETHFGRVSYARNRKAIFDRSAYNSGRMDGSRADVGGKKVSAAMR